MVSEQLVVGPLAPQSQPRSGDAGPKESHEDLKRLPGLSGLAVHSIIREELATRRGIGMTAAAY